MTGPKTGGRSRMLEDPRTVNSLGTSLQKQSIQRLDDSFKIHPRETIMFSGLRLTMLWICTANGDGTGNGDILFGFQSRLSAGLESIG